MGIHVAVLLLYAGPIAVEPEPIVKTELTERDLRVYVTMHAFALKECLRAHFGRKPTDLRITLTASTPHQPTTSPVLTGGNEPDPLLRTTTIDLRPYPHEPTLACMRESIEHAFRNVSYYHSVPNRVSTTVVYSHLNRLTTAAEARIEATGRSMRERITKAQPWLDRCMTERHPPRMRATLTIFVLANGEPAWGSLKLHDQDPGFTDDCLQSALGLDRARTDEFTEPVEIQLEMTRPAEPMRWRRPQPQPEPSAE